MERILYIEAINPAPEGRQTSDKEPAKGDKKPAGGKDDPPRDREQPLTEHIRELRKRVIVFVAVFAIATIVALPFSGIIADLILENVLPTDIQLTVYAPIEWMQVRIAISVVCALGVGLPLLIYEIFAFMAPGLYPKESRYIKLVIPFSFGLFFAGISIAYFLTIPLFFMILISYSEGFAVAQLSAGMVFNTVITVMLGFGVVFQLPIVVLGAVRLHLIEYSTLKTLRIVVYGLLFAISIFLSPDPTFISQMIVTVVLILLYELSLLLVRLFGWGGVKKKKRIKRRKKVKSLITNPQGGK